MQFSEKSILDAIGDPIFCIDGKLEITYSNNAAEEFFATTKNLLAHKTMQDFIAEVDKQKVLNLFQHDIPNRIISVMIHNKHGSKIPLTLKFSKLAISENEFWYVVSSQDNIAVELFNQYELSLEKYVTFLYIKASTSHHINNPLEIIKNYSYILQTELDDANHLHYLEAIDEEITKISKSIGHLDMSDRKLKRIEVDLHKLMDEIVTIAVKWAQNHNIDIDFNVPSGLKMLRTSYELLKEIIFFFIIIEFLAMSGGGRMTIKLSQNDNETCISITDTVVDLPSRGELLAMLRSGKKRDRQLSVCYNLLSKLNASFEIHTIENTGTRFTLRFPY